MPFIKINNKNIHYNQTGKGEPLFLLHNGFYSTSTWDNVRDNLSKHFTVIDYDRFGYGKSDKLESQLTDDIVDIGVSELEGLVAHFGHDRIHIIGHCLGGAIALLYAVKHPDKVNKVVAESVGYFSDHKIQVKADWTFQDYNEISEELRTMLCTMHGEEYSKIMWEYFCDYTIGYIMNPEYNILDEIKKVTCPVLLMNGDRDFYFDPEHTIKAYKKIKNSELFIVPNTGHDIHVESEKYFVDAIINFFNK